MIRPGQGVTRPALTEEERDAIRANYTDAVTAADSVVIFDVDGTTPLTTAEKLDLSGYDRQAIINQITQAAPPPPDGEETRPTIRRPLPRTAPKDPMTILITWLKNHTLILAATALVAFWYFKKRA